MSISMLLAFSAFASGLNILQATEVCPLQLDYTVSLPGEEFEAAVDAGFENWIKTRESRFHLAAVSHYGRHPNTETALVLFDFEYATPSRIRESDKSANAWVVCHYDGSEIDLVRQLPEEISYCQYDRDSKALECLYNAPSEPEAVAVGGALPAGSLAVLVVGSVRECRLKINGTDVGMLLKNRDRAFNVTQGEAEVACVANDGAISRGRIDARVGEDVPYRVAW